MDYVESKPDRVLDLQLDAEPLRRFALARGIRPINLRKAVERLEDKRLLHRLQHGRYVASRGRVPAHSARLDDLDPAAAAVLRRLDVDYYLSWHSALWQHGLLDQQSRRLYVAVGREKRPVRMGLAEIRFVQVTERKFFGGQLVEDFEWPVKIAAVEKALIDSFDRPPLAAPVPVIANALRTAWREQRLDTERLVADTIRFGSHAVARRLGFFMDLYEIPGSDPLTLHLGRRYAVPLSPGDEPPAGTVPVNPRWRVYEQPDVIAAALELK